MAREFECKREVILAGTPEDAWAAVATSAGHAAWLFPGDIPADGSGARVWDPPRHYAVRQENGDWFNALEFEIEGRDDSTTLLRYAHSGIILENWDAQYDAAQQHTDFYLHTLGQYLEHFNKRPATYIGGGPGGLQGPAASALPDGFARLRQALGVPVGASQRDAVTLTPAGLQSLEAVLDYVAPNFLGARTADGLYRFFGRNAFGGPVGMSIHLFAGDVDVETVTRGWQGWLDTALAS